MAKMFAPASLGAILMLSIYSNSVPTSAFLKSSNSFPRDYTPSSNQLIPASAAAPLHVLPQSSVKALEILIADADDVAAVSATPSDGHLVDTVVFIVGIIPFAWATVEFWRRIAVGASFGTGEDSVVIIGEDGAPQSSRGRRVLGKGALAVAYLLFGVAALSIGIAVYSVLVSPEMSSNPVAIS
eukprot:CAMPEP_0183303860 /NCGR_PEP_ID=MMETSP0160_2-20130417/9148_1 /TAXON_ID=2839 ORGANISM="Odontella Sinensis, Strain Grunow 1884" /NCGR_SAMPLE_ID=MMETSP0160_2 /ASSEMBLY_ACC=CAM_ASM_000250 /LENGTH=183 /DNA_ID=CAMNT_0025466825 /DNA_START=33 /DNA_END=584 /DNA_ORIENTATION=-